MKRGEEKSRREWRNMIIMAKSQAKAENKVGRKIRAVEVIVHCETVYVLRRTEYMMLISYK